jgi:hypothetical protein
LAEFALDDDKPEVRDGSRNKSMGSMTKAKKRMRLKRQTRRLWTKEESRALKTHSKARTPVAKIARQMKRSVGALRQQALKLGIGLGHRR